MEYKIIDYESYGHIIKLYLGNKSLDDWTGEDWDNMFEKSFSPVDADKVAKTIDLVINPDKFEVQYLDDFYDTYACTKNSMKTNGLPFVSIFKRSVIPELGFWDKNSRRYCLGDIIEVDEKKQFITIGF